MSSNRHSRVCINDKRIGMTAKVQEQRFRGSISLTANDCTVSIILVILMLMKWYMVSYVEDYGWARIAYLMKNIFWIWWKSYDSEIRTDHVEIVADELLLEVLRLHKLRRILGHMERIFGCTFLGGALVLLSIMHCWHYDDSEIWSLSWGLSGIGHKNSYL